MATQVPLEGAVRGATRRRSPAPLSRGIYYEPTLSFVCLNRNLICLVLGEIRIMYAAGNLYFTTANRVLRLVAMCYYTVCIV